MDKSLEYEKKVLIDGIDELEGTKELYSKPKFLNVSSLKYERTYKINSENNGVVSLNRYINQRQDKGYLKTFELIRHSENKSDFFDFKGLSAINVKERSHNINRELDVKHLNNNQISLLNNILMLDNTNDKSVLINQYKTLDDNKTIEKLFNLEQDKKSNGSNKSEPLSSDKNGNRSIDYLPNNSKINQDDEFYNEEEEILNYRKLQHSKQNETREENEVKKEKIHQKQGKFNDYEKIINSYGVEQRAIYINQKLNLKIEGKQKDMLPFENQINNPIRHEELNNDEYKNYINDISKEDNPVEKVTDFDVEAIKSINEFNQNKEIDEYYKIKMPNIYKKLVQDYQIQNPNMPLLVNFDKFTDTAIDRFNTQYPENLIDNKVKKNNFQNELINSIKEKGSLINENGDRYVSNLKNTSIDKLISLGSGKDQGLNLSQEMQKGLEELKVNKINPRELFKK